MREFRESATKNAEPAPYGCQLRRRWQLSKKLCQIGQFFLDLVRLSMAAGEQQHRLTGMIGRASNASQQQWTAGDRFARRHWVNQPNKQTPPVIRNSRHSSGDLRELDILRCETAHPHWFFSSSNVFSTSPRSVNRHPILTPLQAPNIYPPKPNSG